MGENKSNKVGNSKKHRQSHTPKNDKKQNNTYPETNWQGASQSIEFISMDGDVK